MAKNDEWEDVVIWDQGAILAQARECVHNAFIARQAGDFRLCSSYATKALDALGDCEEEYPHAVAALRGSLERL